MADEIQRPLDTLNEAKGKSVLVELKGGIQFMGTLRAFDIHINIVLDNAQENRGGEVIRKLGRVFIRGDTIIMISPSEQ